MKKITILAPAYNESLNLPRMVEALDRLADGKIELPKEDNQADPTKYEWEYLFVNDGSKDNTLEVLKTRSHGYASVCHSRSIQCCKTPRASKSCKT